jgi:hypothetical protein
VAGLGVGRIPVSSPSDNGAIFSSSYSTGNPTCVHGNTKELGFVLVFVIERAVVSWCLLFSFLLARARLGKGVP